MTRKLRKMKVYLFSAGIVKAVCISAQIPKGLPTLKVKQAVLHLRWTSLGLSYWGFLLCLALFSLLFLLFVASQWAYPKPSSFVIIPPQLYKETVLVLLYFLCHLQFPITKVNRSCIDLLDLDL